VHTGGQAAGAARALGARAFTYGSDIAFAPGQLSPSSGEGRRLLAHELVHVVQQSGGAAGAETVHRDALDPANPHAWSFIGSPHRRTTWAADTYEGTLGQAPGASLELNQEIQQTGVPDTDDQKAEFRRRAETLVRLNALGYMYESS
jgi:hypothetical protein